MANSGSRGQRGYSQNGGGYLMVITDITPAQLNVLTPGTGSGGAATAGSLASAVVADLPMNTSSFFTAGRLLKDMGKTVVSAGRSFRKVQATVGTATNSSATFGVNGSSTGSVAGSPGYASFYLETGFEGAGNSIPRVVRFM